MKFVCDDSFVPGILKDTNTSVSPTKCTENEKKKYNKLIPPQTYV